MLSIRTLHILLWLAAVLALTASVIVLVTPYGVMVAEEGGAPEIRTFSWFETQGWWGIAILFIFSGLYTLPAILQRAGRGRWALVFGAGAMALTVLAGFSIGAYYWPAALALLLSLIVAILRR